MPSQMGHSAMTNNRGGLINGIIKLGPAGATIFYSLTSCAGITLSRGGAGFAPVTRYG
jgi:hypothetical protein